MRLWEVQQRKFKKFLLCPRGLIAPKSHELLGVCLSTAGGYCVPVCVQMETAKTHFHRQGTWGLHLQAKNK